MRHVLPIVAFALALSGCSGDATPTLFAECKPTHIVRDGEHLPDCEFELMGGGSISLGDLRGKPVVLNFWTSWCSACKREMPAMQRVFTALGDRVQFVGMQGLGVLDDTREDGAAFLADYPVSYPIAFDENGRLYSHFWGSALRSPRYPLTLFVDAGGVVKKTSFGEQAEEDLRSSIETLFGIA